MSFEMSVGLVWLWAACILKLRAMFLCCWRICIVSLALELVGPWVELGFSICMEAFQRGNGTPLQYSCLENPMNGEAWWAAVHGVTKSRTRLSNFSFTSHFHALEKKMATHSSVLAWRIPGMGEPGGLPSMGLHRVGHDWSDLTAVAAAWRRFMSSYWLIFPGVRSSLVFSGFGLKPPASGFQSYSYSNLKTSPSIQHQW